jgi:hypothetical protein
MWRSIAHNALKISTESGIQREPKLVTGKSSSLNRGGISQVNRSDAQSEKALDWIIPRSAGIFSDESQRYSANTGQNSDGFQCRTNEKCRISDGKRIFRFVLRNHIRN